MSDERDRIPAGVSTPANWGQALFALLATFAVVIVAFAAPLAVHSLVEASGVLDAQDVETSATVKWLHILSFQATIVVLTVLIAMRAPREILGWRAPIGRRSWLQPLLLTIAVSIVTGLIAFTFFADIVARDLAPIQRLVEAAPLWIAFTALAIGAPLSEELLFRGFLLHALKETPLGFWGAALIANIGWTMLHFGYSWLSLADVFLAGLLFSWALWRTQSIWVPIAFHAIYNAVVLFALLIPSLKETVPAFWPAFWSVAG